MKKIILTIVLSSVLPAIAIAEDKTMQNANPNASLMSGKHMMNSSPNASVMKGKHMTSESDNPFSSHAKAKATNTSEKAKKGYNVIKYKE